MKRRRRQSHGLTESLETRALLSGVSAFINSDRILMVEGTAGNDTFDVSMNDAAEVVISCDDMTQAFSALDFDDVWVFAGDGDDAVTFDLPVGRVVGGKGNDTLTGSAPTIRGDAGNDLITGSDADELIAGGSGNDTLFGGDGDDTMGGGSGKDRIDTGNGDDIANGHGGRDALHGTDGNDTLTGGRRKRHDLRRCWP